MLIYKMLISGYSVIQGRLSLRCLSHACTSISCILQRISSETKQVHACYLGLVIVMMV